MSVDTFLAKPRGGPIGTRKRILKTIKDNLPETKIEEGTQDTEDQTILAIEDGEHVADVHLFWDENSKAKQPSQNHVNQISLTGRSYDSLVAHLAGAFGLVDEEKRAIELEAQGVTGGGLEGASTLPSSYLDKNGEDWVEGSRPKKTNLGTFYRHADDDIKWWQCGNLSIGDDLFCHLYAEKIAQSDLDSVGRALEQEQGLRKEAFKLLKAPLSSGAKS